MFHAFGKNAQRQNFSTRHRLVTGRPVREHARQLRHFGEPTTIVFAFALDIKFHSQRSGINALLYAAATGDAQRIKRTGGPRRRQQERSRIPARPVERKVGRHGDESEVAQTLSHGIDCAGSRANNGDQDTHHWHLPRLLCGGGERPCEETTCKAANERSPVYHLFTSLTN